MSITPISQATDPDCTIRDSANSVSNGVVSNGVVSDGEASAASVLIDLRERFPDATFLALGQTALWDEPTKATLRAHLDRVWPDARMIAGAHDTDYFAKLPGHPASAGETPFAIVGHDDAATRGLWSAAGEMSRLFGSEDVATRAQLTAQAGVVLHRALALSDDRDETLARLSRAWGWTGIIETGWEKHTAAEIRLDEILPTLVQQVRLSIDGSADTLIGRRADEARAFGTRLIATIESFASAHPGATLPDLYCHLLPHLYETLLGHAPRNFSTTRTSELLQLNRATAARPRFAIVDAFLGKDTRLAAKTAYDRAVAGSGIYALDDLGDGALPFDLVVPGKGRGTIRLLDSHTVRVDSAPAIEFSSDSPIRSVAALASAIEDSLGPDCALVGKAVTLLPMLAAEFVIVFHEGASGYSDRSANLVTRLRERNIALPTLRPILRLEYSTWDSLAAIAPADDAEFVLPEHLRQAKGRERVAIDDFSVCWRRAMHWEKDRLKELSSLKNTREILGYLARTEGPDWLDAARRYDDATQTLLALTAKSDEIRAKLLAIQADVKRSRAEVVALERAKGNDFRARCGATKGFPIGRALEDEEIDDRFTRFDTPIAALRATIRKSLSESRARASERLSIERGDDAIGARATLRRIEADAERARAIQGRNALQTVNGLPHANFRPSAWWFPVVDPSGAWFARVTQTARFHLEPLGPEPRG